MKNLAENEELCFLEEERAEETFEKITSEDRWISVLASQVNAIAVENVPIFVEQVRNESKIAEDVSDESVIQTMTSGIQLGLNFPYGDGVTCYPVAETGFISCLQRAGFQQSTSLSGREEKREFIPLLATERALILNLGLKTQCDKLMKILVRDEKIRYVGSSEYSELPFNELLRVFKEGLTRTFSDVKFITASADHEYFSARYEMSDSILEENFRKILESARIKVKDFKLSCRLTSSDVGLSSACIYPYISSRELGEMVLGKPISLEHKGGHTIEIFKNTCVSKIFSLFRIAEETFEKMATKKIVYPGGAFKRIAKGIGLPKKSSIIASERFVAMFANPTWLDLYWAIYEAYTDYEASNGGFTQAQKLNYEEQISRILFSVNTEYYDAPFEWE